MPDRITVEGFVAGKRAYMVEPWDFPGDTHTWPFGIWMRDHIGQRVRVTAEVLGGAPTSEEPECPICQCYFDTGNVRCMVHRPHEVVEFVRRGQKGDAMFSTVQVHFAGGSAQDEWGGPSTPSQPRAQLSWDACPMPEKVERLRKEIQTLRREYGYLLRDVAGVRNLFRRLKSHSHDPQGKAVVPVDVDSVVDLVIRDEKQKAGRADPLA